MQWRAEQQLADDQSRRHSIRLPRTNTGEKTAGSSIEFRTTGRGRYAAEAAERKRLGGWGRAAAASTCSVEEPPVSFDCVRRGQGSAAAAARSPGLAAFITASTDDALQERERAEARKHTSNGRTPPWYAPDGHKATSNFAVRDSVRSAQPSGGLAPTHAAAGTWRTVENDAEMAERAWACQFYSRGEIPPWLREWSPDDMTFIRSMAPLDQSYFAKLISVPNLAAFIAF